jgi:membrane fusion protein, multidrug efflux system
MNEPSFSKQPSMSTQRTPLHRRRSFWVIVLFIIVVVGIFRYSHQISSSKTKEGRGAQRAPVVVAIVKTQDVPVYLDALGTVIPAYSVTVMTQINGILMRVLFHEGQMVKKGDLLAEIDNRPYLAQLIQNEGQLSRDQATLVNAKIDLKRYQTLWKQDSISQQTLATQEALVKQLDGTVKFDVGQLEATKINLIYCKITSPVDGRIGLRLVDPGNYVQTTNTGGIAIVNTLNPITVIFSIPEDNIPDDRGQSKLLATGKVLTINNQIDDTTGTVKVKALFENKDNTLFPSQFVNVRLLVKTLKNAITIPTAAIQNSSEKGRFIYVLNRETMTVKVIPVTIGITMNDTTTITSGVKPGESVITAGTDKLTDGAKVTLPSTNAAKMHKKEQNAA